MKIPKIGHLKNLAKIGRAFVLANRPELLFGVAVASTVGSTVLAAKGGYEARGLVVEEENRRLYEGDNSVYNGSVDMTLKEKAQLTWKCYVPAGVALTTAVGSTTGLHLVHIKEKKALVQASLMAIEEMKDHDEVRNIARRVGLLPEDEVEELVDNERGVIPVLTSNGVIDELYLVRDAKTGRDVWSNEATIEASINQFNRWLTKQGDSELNHFYNIAGFEQTPDGDDYGWNKGEHVELKWDLCSRDDGRPVRRFTFRPEAKGLDRSE